MNARGSMLMQCVVILALLMMMATMLLKNSFSGRNIQAKFARQADTSAVLESVRGQIFLCLHDSGYPNPDPKTGCNPTAVQAKCLPSAYRDDKVKIVFSGEPPLCRMQISVTR